MWLIVTEVSFQVNRYVSDWEDTFLLSLSPSYEVESRFPVPPVPSHQQGGTFFQEHQVIGWCLLYILFCPVCRKVCISILFILFPEVQA